MEPMLADYEFWTMLGTVGAVVVALAVALTQAGVSIQRIHRQRLRERRKVASLVSTWVEHYYEVSDDGRYYRRIAHLHISNESDEPIYRVEVLCGIAAENGIIQVGPLAAPRVIPTLPPRREFSYDITMGLLAFGDYTHDAFRGLLAKVAFRDHEGQRWERDFEGDLTKVVEVSGTTMSEAQDELAFAQAGPIENVYNPLSKILYIANLAMNKGVTIEEFKSLLTGEAEGWSRLSETEMGEFRNVLSHANLATHVWYLTPRIAYVRILDDRNEDKSRAGVITMVWRNGSGWKLFGHGPFQPWDIPFDKDELRVDPLDGRD